MNKKFVYQVGNTKKVIHCCLYLCAVEGGYLRGLVEGTYLDFLYRICACCKIYLDTLYKVDTLASFIGQIDLLALCAVYADVLYRVSSTSRQHVYDTSTAEVSEFFFLSFDHGTLCTSVNIYGTRKFCGPSFRK